MLVELRVGNLALVDEVIIPFSSGLTLLTGETGAGKSLIAGALSLLCGAKSTTDFIRRGEEIAFIEGLFDLSGAPEQRATIQALGIRIGTDGILVLRREIRREGRNRVLINGLVSSLALLEQIGPVLLAVQSQDQTRELNDPGFARKLLDNLLNNEETLTAYQTSRQQYHELAAALAQRRQETALAREQMDMWRYQHGELQVAALRVGEEAELAEKLTLKRHASTLHESAAAALQHLADGDYPARERLGECLSALRPTCDKSTCLEGIWQDLQSAEETLAEATLDLNRFLDELDLDAAGLDELESRLALYTELQRKYQCDTSGLCSRLELLAERLERQESASDDLARMEDELADKGLQLAGIAGQLHERRRHGAGKVAQQSLAAIRPLALPDLELEFRVSLCPDPAGPITIDRTTCRDLTDGADRVDLFIRTNPGEQMGKVSEIASGGERSRIYLGLILQQQQGPEVPLLLFDEIDAGLGMDAAIPVARVLRELANRGQVMVITHLPTMAVHGQTHLRVQKKVRDGRTKLTVRQLSASDRVEEVARLLGGEGWGEGDRGAQHSYAMDL
ncbi:MAG: AAA family ATPase, partial [bacterium]